MLTKTLENLFKNIKRLRKKNYCISENKYLFNSFFTSTIVDKIFTILNSYLFIKNFACENACIKYKIIYLLSLTF